METALSNKFNDQPWSVRTADSVMKRNPTLADRWAYEWGLVAKAIEQVWLKTHDARYYKYVKKNVDEFVDSKGNIKTYRIEEYNLDQINAGKVLFLLYDQTGDERYKKAIYLLRDQLRTQPRTSEGGFWHKQIYPRQMWLDGIYMASPFYAAFGKWFNEPEAFDDVARQIILIAQHTRDQKTGLFYHGWDEGKIQPWANRETGCSPNFWGRAIGWYSMAIPDVLDYMPEDHPQRNKIIDIFRGLVSAIAQVQDNSSGVWYQVLDQQERPGNYLEASASCMFVYAIVKGVRKGYIDKEYLNVARKGYEGVLKNFIQVDSHGLVNVNWICSVGGLGGQPSYNGKYRDGSFEYYISEPIVTNDYKGVGAFILASVEMESIG